MQEKKGNQILLGCLKCGNNGWKAASLEPSHVECLQKESVIVIGRETQRLRTFPTVRIECPKCGNRLAYAWEVQTRSLEQASTQFFRCTRCNYTIREQG